MPPQCDDQPDSGPHLGDVLLEKNHGNGHLVDESPNCISPDRSAMPIVAVFRVPQAAVEVEWRTQPAVPQPEKPWHA